jgi:hypothetical protein
MEAICSCSMPIVSQLRGDAYQKKEFCGLYWYPVDGSTEKNTLDGRPETVLNTQRLRHVTALRSSVNTLDVQTALYSSSHSRFDTLSSWRQPRTSVAIRSFWRFWLRNTQWPCSKLRRLVAGFPRLRSGFDHGSSQVKSVVGRVTLGQVSCVSFYIAYQSFIPLITPQKISICHPGLIQ